MDDSIARQLVRQLKVINFWITLFGTLFLVVFIILGILIFKMITYVQHTEQKLSDIQTSVKSSVNVKQQLCDNKSIKSFLSNKTDTCK